MYKRVIFAILFLHFVFIRVIRSFASCPSKCIRKIKKILVNSPFSAVKEQVSDLYTKTLTENSLQFLLMPYTVESIDLLSSLHKAISPSIIQRLWPAKFSSHHRLIPIPCTVGTSLRVFHSTF